MSASNVGMLQEGNRRRKTEATDANAASSRSHAILEVTVCRSDKNHYNKQVCFHPSSCMDAASCMHRLLCIKPELAVIYDEQKYSHLTT